MMAPMPGENSRKVFIVVAGGHPAAERHFEDTIQRKRTLDEVRRFAAEDRRRKVFDELRRPTFSGPCLRLQEVIRFLGYGKIREIDEASKNAKDFDTNVLLAAGESVPPFNTRNHDRLGRRRVDFSCVTDRCLAPLCRAHRAWLPTTSTALAGAGAVGRSATTWKGNFRASVLRVSFGQSANVHAHTE